MKTVSKKIAVIIITISLLAGVCSVYNMEYVSAKTVDISGINKYPSTYNRGSGWFNNYCDFNYDATEGLLVFNMDKSYAYTMGTVKRTSSYKKAQKGKGVDYYVDYCRFKLSKNVKFYQPKFVRHTLKEGDVFNFKIKKMKKLSKKKAGKMIDSGRCNHIIFRVDKKNKSDIVLCILIC